MSNFKTAKLFDADGDITQRWFVFYYFKDGETGKFLRFRIWISEKLLTRAQRYERGKALIREINLKLRKGFNPFVQQNRSLSPLILTIDEFLKIKKTTLRNRSYCSYKSYLKHFRTYLESSHLVNIEVESFAYTHAQAYMDHVLEETKRSNRTFNNILQAVRTFFNFVISRQYIEVNPFALIKELPTEETAINALTKEELRIISEQLPSYNYDLYVIALMVFTCFIRPQEIVRLRVSHLIYLDDQLTLGGEITKNRKTETIIVPPQLKQAIKKLDLHFPMNYYVFGNHLKRNPKEASANRIFEQWREFAKTFGISKTIYALKHTGNGLALKAGANTRDLQLQNRHSSLDETQKYLERFRRTVSDEFINSFPRL